MTQGDVLFMEGKSEWMNLALDQEVSDEITVKLGNQSYLALFDIESKKIVELHEAGEYDAKAIAELFTASLELPALSQEYFNGFIDRTQVLRCRCSPDDHEYQIYPFLDVEKRFKVYELDTVEIDLIKKTPRALEAHATFTDLYEIAIWKDPMFLDSLVSRKIPVKWFFEDAEEPFVLVGVEEDYTRQIPIYNSVHEVKGYREEPDTRTASNRILLQLIGEGEDEGRERVKSLLQTHHSRAYLLYVMLWALENDYPFLAYNVAKKIEPLNGVSGAQDYRTGMASIFGL